MNIDEKIKNIEDQDLALTKLKPVLVEGATDSSIYNIFLKRCVDDFESKYKIIPVNGKESIIDIISIKKDWRGIIDLDDWVSERISIVRSNFPTIFISPRYTIENYFINPEELWEALPSVQRIKIGNNFSVMNEPIDSKREFYVKHGSLWKEVNPLWCGLRNRGFVNYLLEPQNIENSDLIIQKLREWHEFIDPEWVYKTFLKNFEDNINSLSINQQYATAIHGKYFFSNVIQPIFNKLFGQMPKEKRLYSIAKNIPIPNEINTIVDFLYQNT